jgi:beta-glucosidase
MCAYNRVKLVNGSYACQNSKELNGLVKEELGFQGYVVSDWGGTYSGIASIEAGLDLNMPGGLGDYSIEAPVGESYFGGNVTAAVLNGTLEVSRLDDMIVRLMTPYYFLGQDGDYPTIDPSSVPLQTFFVDYDPRSNWVDNLVLNGTSNHDVRADHNVTIRKLGATSTILLKNANRALPLAAPKSIAVFGNDASEDTQGPLNQWSQFEFGLPLWSEQSPMKRIDSQLSQASRKKSTFRQIWSIKLEFGWLIFTAVSSGPLWSKRAMFFQLYCSFMVVGFPRAIIGMLQIRLVV